MTGDDTLQALRDAVRLSPDNVPLRRHLAETLLRADLADQAATEFRAALALAPDKPELKLGLAQSFQRQGKKSEALVVVEDLVKAKPPVAAAFVLHARLLLQAGEAQLAVKQYRAGIAADPGAGDDELASRLGIGAGEDEEVSEGRVRSVWQDDAGPGADDERIERPKVSFKDVGGMEALKDEIRMKIIHPLKHPELFEAYGKKIGGGILLYGPPGCGKTHLARATAGEVKAGFLSVGISDVLEMWIGSSEKNLHELFDQARRNKPCVLFFDEVDALGASRADMRQAHGRHLINQFLAEMDGLDASNEGVLILAATNAPWHLDNAFRRPGRFDRILFVPPPDAAARAVILKILLQGKPTDNPDFAALAAKTDQFSGADLKAVVDQATEGKLADAMRLGKLLPLTTKDLMEAAKRLKPTVKEWFATARNYALYSNQGGAYDDILKYLRL